MTENRPTKPIAADPPSTSSRAAVLPLRAACEFCGRESDVADLKRGRDGRYAHLDCARRIVAELDIAIDALNRLGRFEDTP